MSVLLRLCSNRVYIHTIPKEHTWPFSLRHSTYSTHTHGSSLGKLTTANNHNTWSWFTDHLCRTVNHGNWLLSSTVDKIIDTVYVYDRLWLVVISALSIPSTERYIFISIGYKTVWPSVRRQCLWSVHWCS